MNFMGLKIVDNSPNDFILPIYQGHPAMEKVIGGQNIDTVLFSHIQRGIVSILVIFPHIFSSPELKA